MTHKPSFAKAALLLGGASLLAVAVNAQVSKPNQNSADWLTLQFQSSNRGGGSTSGNGGVINGPTPRPITAVTVAMPSSAPRP